MSENPHILVTGGAGYIGSHMAVELIAHGYRVTVLDNLSNSSIESIRRVEKITGQKIPFYKVDLRDLEATKKVFAENDFEAVIHFAALKSVSKSIADPLVYYRNNIGSTLNVCEGMREYGVSTLIFSSTAAVYGNAEHMPLTEESPLQPNSPYGNSKAIAETVLKDVAKAQGWRVTILRHFNVLGAHESGLIGENPNGPPDNVAPYITQVALGQQSQLRIYGDDYPTPDGTGVRDYIHVNDLVTGHLAALAHPAPKGKAEIYNLGTGQGYSVMQALDAFRKVTSQPIPHEVVGRRPGDIAVCYADPTKAEHHLKWRAQKTLDEMCADHWRWQRQNPHGYRPAK